MKKIIVAIVFFFSLNSHALQWGAYLGFNYTEYESNVSWDHSLGLEGGAAVLHMITNNLLLRTGAGYVQKNSSSKAIGFGADIEVSYIEVPITIFFKAFGEVALIGGVNVDLKVADKCGGGSCSSLDIEDYVMNTVIGASFRTKGGEQVETLLEMNGLTDIANDISMGTSLSVRYVYMF